MSDDVILYAKAGGPPGDWWNCQVFDAGTGAEIANVIECDVVEGWAVRYRTDAAGRFLPAGGGYATEKIEGCFEIRRHRPQG